MTENVATSARWPAGFPAEWRAFWRSLPMRWVWLGLSAVWIGWFAFQGNSTLGYVNTRSLFGWWVWVYSRGLHNADGTFSWGKFVNSDSVHAWFIPLVVFLLLWSKRRELVPMPKRVWWPGFAILGLAVLLHLGGFAAQQTRLSLVGFFLGIYALMGLFWGKAWLRESFVPFLLFAFCVPLPGGGEFVTFPLRLLSTKLSVGVSNLLLGLDVDRLGTQIISGSGKFQYDVAPACSGIRSLQIMLAITAVYGYLTFAKTWKRLLILVLAFPLAVAGNVLRITSAILVGEVFGHDAGSKIEQPMGLLTFPLALVALFVVGHWLRERPADDPPADVAATGSGPPLRAGEPSPPSS